MNPRQFCCECLNTIHPDDPMLTIRFKMHGRYSRFHYCHRDMPQGHNFASKLSPDRIDELEITERPAADPSPTNAVCPDCGSDLIENPSSAYWRCPNGKCGVIATYVYGAMARSS